MITLLRKATFVTEARSWWKSWTDKSLKLRTLLLKNSQIQIRTQYNEGNLQPYATAREAAPTPARQLSRFCRLQDRVWLYGSPYGCTTSMSTSSKPSNTCMTKPLTQSYTITALENVLVHGHWEWGVMGPDIRHREVYNDSKGFLTEDF